MAECGSERCRGVRFPAADISEQGRRGEHGVLAGWAARRAAPGSARAPAANKKADITGKKYGLIWRQTVIFLARTDSNPSNLKNMMCSMIGIRHGCTVCT